MTNTELVAELRKKIKQEIGYLFFGRSAILTDLPYHGNVGDILIWEGEISFLKDVGASLLSQSSSNTFQFPEINKDIIICLHGGGNFGDLYRGAQSFRKKVIEHYPDNRIVILPQSVWYVNKELIAQDAEAFALHKDLHICARDLYSYQFLERHFGENNLHLVPDMAFYISKKLSSGTVNGSISTKSLFIRRLDKEKVKDEFTIGEQADDRDWPIFEGRTKGKQILFGLIRRLDLIRNERLFGITCGMIDKLMSKRIKPTLIKQGVEMLQPYDRIFTTRLHAMILGILMDKEIIVFDNTTRKLSAFYETWLQEDNSVKLQRSHQ